MKDGLPNRWASTVNTDATPGDIDYETGKEELLQVHTDDDKVTEYMRDVPMEDRWIPRTVDELK